MQTQWRVIAGMGGAVYQGLDYSSLPLVFDALHVRVYKRRPLLADLQVMERAAITVYNARPSDS